MKQEPEKKSLRDWVHEVVEWVRRVVTEPRDELSRWERRARFAYDLGRYGAKKLRRDSAPQMAAALSYRTLFSLLPILVVGTMIMRAVGGFSHFRVRIAEWLGSLGLDDIEIASRASDVAQEPSIVPSSGAQTLSSWILHLLDEAEKIDLTAITWVGVTVLVYSGVSLMVTIEKSFNTIHRAPGGRPWSRRLPIYWTLLSLGPVAIAFTMYLSNQLDQFVAAQTGSMAILKVLSPLSGFVGTWLVMFVTYKWLPNTHVRFRPAMIGALVAAVLLEGGKEVLTAYVGNAFSVRMLYGSLGLIPLFMFWVYIMWLIVLFGTEVSSAVQKFAGGVVEEESQARPRHHLADPGAIVAVVEMVAHGFADGVATDPRDIGDELGLEERTVEVMLRALADERIVHRVEGDERQYALSMPLDAIEVDRLLAIGFELVGETAARRAPILERMREAQRELAKSQTLGALLRAEEAEERPA